MQLIVWGNYGRMERKCFMGVARILLEELDLSSMVIGWYKLFPTSSMVEPTSAPLLRHSSQMSLESAVGPCCERPWDLRGHTWDRQIRQTLDSPQVLVLSFGTTRMRMLPPVWTNATLQVQHPSNTLSHCLLLPQSCRRPFCVRSRVLKYVGSRGEHFHMTLLNIQPVQCHDHVHP